MATPKTVADLTEFSVALGRQWGALVTGAFSLPFVLAGALTERDYQQYIWWAMAVAALLASYYIDHTTKKARIRELEEELRPKLHLEYAPDRTKKRSDGAAQTFVLAINDGANDARGAQVKVAESKFRKKYSEGWERTNLIARTNLSWCFLVDGHLDKYSTVQLPRGSETLDFITGPVTAAHQDGTTVRAFILKMDPRHGPDPSIFYEKGLYRFVLQISGLDSGEPHELPIYVEWDGTDLAIRLKETADVEKKER